MVLRIGTDACHPLCPVLITLLVLRRALAMVEGRVPSTEAELK